MIDFRYHVVSLVAVFLALAVGIALGAGPLREGVSSTLESQVQELRDERAALRSELDQTRAREEAKEDLIAEVAPVLGAGQLRDVRVATVVLPGAPEDLVESTEQSLRQGGAVVVSRARLPEWDEDEAVVARWAEATAQVADGLEEPSVAAGSPSTPATMLAAVLTGSDAQGQDGAWLEAEQRLVSLGLLEVEREDVVDPDGPVLPGSLPDPPEALVLVGGGLTGEDVAQEEGTDRLARRLTLVRAVGSHATPALLVGAGAEGVAAPGQDLVPPLVSAVREDRGSRREVATVDNGEAASGQLSVVLGLAQALLGDVGHYGLGPGAQSLAPEVPERPGPGAPTAPDGADEPAGEDASTTAVPQP